MRRLDADSIIALLLLIGSAELFRQTFFFRAPPFATLSASFWPRAVLGVLVALSLIYLVRSLRAAPAAAAPAAHSHRVPLICFGLFLLFLVSLPWAGMLLGGIGFVFLLQTSLGPRGWRDQLMHLTIAVVSVGGMWALFRFGLKVILPEGLFLRL